MLISDLSRLKILPLIERAELQALVEELGLGQSGLVDAGTAPKIGRLLKARYLVGGSFAPAKEKLLRIQGSLLDVVPETAIPLPGTEGRLQKLLDLEKTLLDHIFTQLKIELTDGQKRALKKPLSPSFDALMALFMGIDAGDRGNYDEAALHYSAALKSDPQLMLAKDAMDELHRLNLIGPSDRSDKKGRLLRKTRQRTSFSTTLTPALPVARIPHPAGVDNDDQRIQQIDDLFTGPTTGLQTGQDTAAQP